MNVTAPIFLGHQKTNHSSSVPALLSRIICSDLVSIQMPPPFGAYLNIRNDAVTKYGDDVDLRTDFAPSLHQTQTREFCCA